MRMWTDDGVVAVDFETSGEYPEYALQPWRLEQGKFWATSLAWVWREGSRLEVGGKLNPGRKTMREFLEFAIRQKRRGLCWNALFDLSVFQAYGFTDLVQELKWLDGMLLYRHLEVEPEYDLSRENKRSFGLKPAVATFLPEYAGYEEDIDYHDPRPSERAKLHEYNVRDNVFTLRISRRLWRALNPQQRKVALIEAECLPMVARANLEGMLIDTPVCAELKEKLTKVAADSIAKLSYFGVTEKIVRSPTKLAELMFDQWKLPVLKMNTGKKTKKVTRSTDKEVLHELSFRDTKVKTLRTYREALNNRTKFATAPLKAVEYNGDGRAHPLARVFGTYSGRMTYASKQGKNKDARQIGWAIHQEKREKEFRVVLVAPPGYTLVEFDAAGQEYRWMAEASQDPVMIQLCQPGEDPHSFMGARVTDNDYGFMVARLAIDGDDPVVKPWRQLGKVANLSLQYRTSARKLRVVARVQYDIPMELPQAQLIHTVYPRSYKRIPIYWSEQIADTKRKGYVETLAGRRVQVVGNWDGTMGWSMGSTAINYRIQGTGGDQKYLALACMEEAYRTYDARFQLDMHDGIYSLVPDQHVDKFCHTVKKILDNLPYKQAWGLTPSIPLPWDCKTGKSWGSLKGYHF